MHEIILASQEKSLIIFGHAKYIALVIEQYTVAKSSKYQSALVRE